MARAGNELQCPKCETKKSEREFYRSKTTKSGLTSWCKICCASASSSWYKRNKDRAHFVRVNAKYGISEEDYYSLLKAQESKCKICGIDEDKLKQRLHIDHCHTSGKIRGLLCSNCNTGIGNLRDDVSLLEKAIQYLNSYNEVV